MKKAEEEYGDIPLLVHTDLKVVDEGLNMLSESMFDIQKLPEKQSVNNLLVQNSVTGCTMLFNDKLRDIIKYENIDNIIMHDHYIALVAAVFGKIVFLNESTIKYRQHGDNQVGAKDVTSAEYISSRINNKEGIKKSLEDTYKQAQEFYNTYGENIPSQYREMIRVYSEFGNLSKIKKIGYMNKFSLYKNTLARKIGQIIWG